MPDPAPKVLTILGLAAAVTLPEELTEELTAVVTMVCLDL
jgi:hypothetical protein